MEPNKRCFYTAYYNNPGFDHNSLNGKCYDILCTELATRSIEDIWGEAQLSPKGFYRKKIKDLNGLMINIIDDK